MARFKAYAGRRQISRKLDATSAGFAQSMKASMQEIVSRYQEFVDAVDESTPEVLLAALQPTFDKSQRYCPTKTGAMKESGYLENVSFRGKPVVEIGYGKNGKPSYTAQQHENLNYRHAAPTRAKWLQVALEEDAQDIQQRVIDGLKRFAE